MQILQKLALCLLASTCLCVPTDKLLRSTEIKLLELMKDTRAEQRDNPEQSLACFEYYLKVFEQLNVEYRESYAACLATARHKRDQIDESTQPERDAIEESALSTCTALKGCAQLADSVLYFNCFAINGKQGSENMYKISADASETLAEVSEQYRLIETEEHRCTNATGRVYVEKSHQASEDLSSCLRGEITVPSPTSTASTPPSEDSSTTGPGMNWKSDHISDDELLLAIDSHDVSAYRKPNGT
ncbi:PREDICTED: uncharacterized protein LOC108966092 [Bactrocera latifrons]|uniref:Protein TsetseEP domain-containing protein n=1 Tax=Bactrocera latifrons TaxID=174628 RepID=A0A0K8TVB5_BACLA|nr:PREDICTED: uncharacterized protein LOC108966092 [Bactrocera latifrons]